ncbi:uncharacterized protein TRIADDRAFT_26147 [Trichoplax adhaerens]|uniref:Protein SCAI n=1 Tax=Trichoplax adhaerens TaxID=10228 RepID=B3S0R6_TRIAD|nr:hypothetical protein TRIADDRAFT_26147 [Trichoplax adhaerens]EDV24055.1 hypothetical protein TRIADDRAFT_26147 [Trichoplax adhaerens]|eukprot:XP_002113581.1 hypothetical protein TRIADDRAFT_26147 [Trichoplax adhaerens]
MANENKIVEEFTALLDKSKQLFNGMRELPQFGHYHWQNYFAKTFDVYTKLWKFQQKHRQILDNKLSLKRWQIGEIASKIGQLYYHYYLRTSDVTYLLESYSFYRAIHGRAYYNKAVKEEKPDIMIKKLRYYARFIVVCLLLRKTDTLSDLVTELSRCVDEYVEHYEVKEGGEWQIVLKEIHSFLAADGLFQIIKDDGATLMIQNRLKSQTIPIASGSFGTKLKLTDVIIVGNCTKQVKFSELTIDMYRMLQVVEYVSSKFESTTNEIMTKNDTKAEEKQNKNPHKCLLYRPTFFQLYAFLSSTFKELPSNSIALIYISADGSPKVNLSERDGYYDAGGVSTLNKNNSTNSPSKTRASQVRDSNCLHPEDLIPFSRKPMFIIIESDNGIAFSNFPQLFGQPLVCLMSPVTIPATFSEKSHLYGNFFTMFLHCPLMGFCYICEISEIQHNTWEECETIFQDIWQTIATNIENCPTLGFSFRQFIHDEFLRLLIYRYIFCYCTLSLHKLFKNTNYYPICYPKMPAKLTEAVNLKSLVLKLAKVLNAGQYIYQET